MHDPRSGAFRAFLATLFLGAFNDNIYKLLITLIAITLLASAEAAALFTSMAGLLFIVPFILFSAVAGSIADRIGKTKLIRITKFAEIVIMASTFFAFSTNNLVLMCILLFLLSAQSAFFGPAKYGIIPDLVAEESLSKANGYTQMWTFVAIILGTACAGPLLALGKGQPAALALVLTLIALSGSITALHIPIIPPTVTTEKENQISFLRASLSAFSHIRKDRALLFTFLAINYFWFLGAAFQMNGILYITNMLALDNTRASMLLSLVSIGIACGSLVAGAISGKRISLSLALIGAGGMACFLCVLAFTAGSILFAASALFCVGLAGGLYIVPLNAFYQKETPPKRRATHMANLNMANALAIVCASFFIFMFGTLCRVDPAHTFLALGVVTFATALLILRPLPALGSGRSSYIHVACSATKKTKDGYS